jgi:hypothetical protein
MSMIEYLVQRNVLASTRPGGFPDTRIAMVQVKLPDGGLTQIAIREDEMKFECGGDPAKEQAFVRNRIFETILKEFPGLTLQ